MAPKTAPSEDAEANLREWKGGYCQGVPKEIIRFICSYNVNTFRLKIPRYPLQSPVRSPNKLYPEYTKLTRKYPEIKAWGLDASLIFTLQSKAVTSSF